MRKDFLNFALPLIGEEEIDEVVDSLKSGWLTTGPKTQEFSDRFADLINTKYAVPVSSCTAALHLSHLTHDIGPGDEVITSPLTFCATANVVVHVGATPVFVDITRDVFNIDPNKIEEKITERTKAIIPVHYGGHPCDMDEIMEIAKKHDLTVIEDVAHSPGAEYKGKRIGSIGDTGCFSFYATKNLTTAEGGMLTTDDAAVAEKAKSLSLHGLSNDAWDRYSARGSWYYEVVRPGYKYNMTDIQAAIGLHQLDKFSRFQERRAGIVQQYDEAFSGIAEIETPNKRDYVKHAWHLYPILIDPDLLDIDRAGFIEEMNKENIGTSVHFIPLHLHPFYQKQFGLKRGDYPVVEEVYDRMLSIPLFPKMTDEDVADVVGAVKVIVERHRK